MLPELVARMRGIDKWPSTIATVTNSELFEAPKAGNWNRFSFYYHPEGCELQSGTVTCDGLTSTYKLAKGDTFDIQYDPTNPSRFYCKEAQSGSKTFKTVMRPIVLLFWLALIISVIADALKRHT